MFWITQFFKSSRFNRQRPLSNGFFTTWIDDLNERYMLHEAVRKERALLADMSEGQLRDIGVHRAEADWESQRRYFDIPEGRD